MLSATKKVTAENPVELAVKMCDSAADLARRIGVTRQMVCIWQQRGWFGDRYIEPVSEVTGIPVSKLRTPRNGEIK